MPAELGKAILDLGADSSGLTKDLGNAKGGVGKIGASIGAIGATVGVGLVAAIGSFAVSSIQVAGDFQSSMNRVKAVSGATEDQFKSLGEQAKELGATTQFSASEAADAMGFLAQAGFKADEVMGAMPGTLNLAAAAGIDLATSADIASNVLSGYGIEVAGLGHVNDVLVSAMTKTNTDLLQLGEAMKYAAPVAASAGVGFEEAAAAIGLMGNAGIQGSMAGTSLRGAISRLISPTDNAAAAMNHAGLSFLDAEGRLKPFDDVVRQLEPHAEDTGLMMELFGQRAGPAMAALVSQGADALTDLTGELKDSGGTAERIAEVQMTGFNGAIKQLKSAFEGLQIAVAEAGLIDFATAAVKVLAVFIGKLIQLPKWLINVGKNIMGGFKRAWDWLRRAFQFIIKLLGPLGRLLERLAHEYLANLKLGFDAVAGALKWLWDKAVGFFGWLGKDPPVETRKAEAATEALTFASHELAEQTADTSIEMIEMTDSIEEVEPAVEKAEPKLFDLKKHLSGIERAEKKAATELKAFRKEVAVNLVAGIHSVTPPMIAMTANTAQMAEQFSVVATTLEMETTPAVGNFLTDTVDSFGNLVTDVTSMTTSLSDKMVDSLFTGDLSFAAQAPKQFKALGMSFATDFIGKATNAIKGFITKTIKGQLFGALDGITGKMDVVGKGIGSMLGGLGGAFDGVTEKLKGVTSAATSAVGTIGGAGASAAGSAGSAGASVAGVAGTGLMGMIGAVTGIGTLVSSVIGNFQAQRTNKILGTVAENQVAQSSGTSSSALTRPRKAACRARLTGRTATCRPTSKAPSSARCRAISATSGLATPFSAMTI